MGNLYALLTAFVWAGAVILLKRAGDEIPPFALNFFRVVISTTLFVPTVLLAGQAGWRPVAATDVPLLFASGIIAIAISDTLFHASLNLIGAGISSIVDCLYPPFAVLFAWTLLGERLSGRQFLGMALVLGGVLAAARHAPPPGATRRRILLGSLLGVLAMAALAFGIVIAKPVLEHSPVLWATATRQVGCLLVLGPIALASPRRREIFRLFRPSRIWRFALPGAVLGSYVSLILWIAVMKYTKVGVAAILNQSSVIYILFLTALFLGEPFTRRKAVASALALAGIILVTL